MMKFFFKEAISLTTQTLFQVFFLILQTSNEPFLKKLKKRPSNYLKFKGGELVLLNSSKNICSCYLLQYNLINRKNCNQRTRNKFKKGLIS